MSINVKMTALADEVRGLGGVSDTLGISAMTDTIAVANESIDEQTDLIAELKEKVNNLPNNSHDVLLKREVTSYVNNSVTSLGAGAFSGWTTIKSISLPEVTYVSTRAFYNCTSLTDLYLPKLISNENEAFRDCDALVSISLPECTSLKGAFCYCGVLKNVSVPKLQQMDNNVFYNCVSLETLELPATFTKILRTNTFNGCTALTKLVLQYAGVVSLASTTSFTNTPIANGTGYIYVPDSLVATYKTATNWSTYANQIKGISEAG